MGNPIIFHTGHAINEHIAATIASSSGFQVEHLADYRKYIESDVLVIGILRGAYETARIAKEKGKNFWFVDNGYWNSPYLRGFYRLSKNCMQQPYVDIDCEFKGAPLEYEEVPLGENVMICPPSARLAQHLKINVSAWIETFWKKSVDAGKVPFIRLKGTSRSLEKDLQDCCFVYSYNSSVSIEALRLGIPAAQEVGSMNGFSEFNLDADYGQEIIKKRKKLFAFLSNCQSHINDLGREAEWNRMMNFVSLSDMTLEKMSPTGLQDTQSSEERSAA